MQYKAREMENIVYDSCFTKWTRLFFTFFIHLYSGLVEEEERTYNNGPPKTHHLLYQHIRDPLITYMYRNIAI